MDRDKVDTVHLVEGDPRNLPFNFPGKEVLQVPRIDGDQRREVNSGNVMVYASLPTSPSAGGAVVRLNLFAELFGVREHVASAFVLAGAPPASVINVSGHVVDGWHLLAHSTSPQAALRCTMASMPCCGPPRVRVNKDNINPPPAALDDAATLLQFDAPPMVPWGRENGRYNQQSVVNVGGGGTTITFDRGARITHMLLIADAAVDATYTIRDEHATVIETGVVPMGERAEWFPNGDLRALDVTVANVVYFLVETVN